LKNRPLGIQKVTNPLPAAGGEAPETIDSARIKAPMSVRTLQRIVSISDYRDFTCSFAGIAKAHVKRLRDGKAHLVHITAAPAGGTALQKNSSLYKNLLESLHTHRAIPVPLRIDSFEPLFFNLHARVTIEADEDAEALENQVKNALQEVFSFKNRQLGWEVSAAEVIVTIQQVKGVRAVDLQALYQVGTPISLTNALQAHTAYWDPGENKIQPAQLLMINNEKDSIILKMEKY
jgi:predicted phage baseplate assembly protein